MQGSNSHEESCQNHIDFETSNALESNKILTACNASNSGCTNDNSVFFEAPTGRRINYGPICDQLLKVETSPNKAVDQKPTRNLYRDNKSSLVKEEMCTAQSSNSDAALKFLSSAIMQNDLLKNLTNNIDERSNKSSINRRKKVGGIVSTSRSGHLIEKKDEFCCSALKKANVNSPEGCDSNDNIIIEEVLNSEMFDINDNPSDKINNQREEETSLSDNAQSGKSDGEPSCSITLLERLIRSHPVWFLPGIQRAGAVHLLQGKEEGNFIVRQSSQAETMAVSVRLPVGKGPYIEHYLIQSVDGQLSLESSENLFESIPSLIAHYCQCCDELPVRLTLPGTIREAKNRQQLSSLALLGQEFWRYPMANPRPPESRNCSPNNNKSDSYGSSDGEKISFKANEEIVLDLMPLNDGESQQSNLMSTFKSSPTVDGISFSAVVDESKPKRPQTLDLNTNSDKTALVNGNKTPPQPPPRWTKSSQSVFTKQSFMNNTTEITTITSTFYSEDECGKLGDFSPFEYDRNVSSPQSDQTNLNSFGFKRDQNSLTKQNKVHLISPSSDSTNFVSKSFEKAQKIQQFESGSRWIDKSDRIFRRSGSRSKKEGKIKESAHYQESDILESPMFQYCKSNVADKQSDYEDIWATDSFTTFKPPNAGENDQGPCKAGGRGEQKKPPDLLEKLENSFGTSFNDEKPGEKTFPNEELPAECLDFGSQIADQYEAKQNSPFYAEPADALVVRRKGRLTFNKSRHSDPFSFNNWSIQMNPYFSGGNILGRVDSQTETNDDSNSKAKSSLSFDNIINLKRKEGDAKSRASNPKVKPNPIKAKPVRPPKIYNFPLEKIQQNWAVDSSWEFIGNEESSEKEGEGRFPSIEQQMDSDEASYKGTVQEMISKRYPQFKISKAFWNKSSGSRMNSFSCQQMQFQKLDNSKTCSRISAYDNLSCDRFNFSKSGNDSDRNVEVNCDGSQIESENPISFDSLRHKRRFDCGSLTVDDNEDAQTIFSEPWDSSRWEKLLPSTMDASEEPSLSAGPQNDSEMADSAFRTLRNSSKSIKKKFFYDERIDLPLPLQQSGLKSNELSTTGASIRSYALHLAMDKSTTFAQNIDNFIECTLESKEANPQVVMRNMRQFMSGMKNYLVKHGEREFEKQVEKERLKLKSTEFLNLDAILEGVMHKLVVRPLREHLYKLFVDEYVKNGAIQLLYENLNYARTKSLRDLGLKTKITPPSQEALKVICYFISKLQEVDSPLEKLDNLLASVSTIIYSLTQSNQGKPGIALGADDILPLFVWVLIQSGFIAAEIEAEYMWGLLHPSLLSGEGCYYLTTLSSAVHVLKNLKSCDLDHQTNRLTLNEGQCRDLKSVLKIIVPDELHGSILTKTLPVKPNMTTKDVCKIIAHKIRITNPQDYGLFRLVDGEETLLNDSDCPQDVKCQFLESGKHCTLAYKRIDAKIGWPRTT